MKCDKKTEVYSRIVGYFRPVQNWNTGKRQEFEDRKVYSTATKIGVAVPKQKSEPRCCETNAC